jgi:signal transduction histidine kinase
MPRGQITETLEPPSDRSRVGKHQQRRWRSDHTKADTARKITLYQPSEKPQETISTIGWFSASILHDLRNPLATICTAAQLLMDLDLPSIQVKRLAANAYRAAGRMRELLTDLSSETCGNKSTPEICDIGEIIAAATDAAAAATDNHRVQIFIDVPARIELPLALSRMKLMFFNLITNALEAMPGGGEVRIAARRHSDYVLVTIEDTGPGIPHGIRDRLFEPFVTAGKPGGLGLGLALSRQSVLDHGGDMWIEPAAGARFVIRLPLNGREGSPLNGREDS